jgi:hypothetical protein
VTRKLALVPIVLLIVAAAPIVLSSTEALAGTGMPIKSPNPAIPAVAGIQLTVDPYWVEGRGYRPVRVEAFASTVVDYDRRISISFSADSAYSHRQKGGGMTVTQEFVLPENAQSASTTIAVPQFVPWRRMGWTVHVDGDYEEDLSVENIEGPSQTGNWDQAAPRVLYVIAVPHLRLPVDAPIPNPARRTWSSRASGLRVNEPYSAHAAGMGIHDLPTRWIDYSCLDIVQISYKELQLLIKQNPKAWQAIRQWVATGGNLIVGQFPFGRNGQDEAKLSVVDRALRDGQSGTDDSQWQSELEPAPNRRAYFDGEPQNIRGFRGDTRKPQASGGQQQSRLPTTFRWRRHQLGTVTAVASQNVRYEVNSSVGPPAVDRQYWTIRHGVEPQWGTEDFWNFLIPGVGLAPVGAFRILITLFVIAIGPVNYYLLRRWRRIHLLVFTIPICAGAITFALFGYALISDGLGTRVRVRSFTEIDQRSGEAACISRQSYYSGLAPGNGLSFSDNTMVVPILAPTYDRWRRYGQLNDARSIRWDERQNLTEGWLASRTPTQYLIVRSRATEHRLDIKSRSGSTSVKNKLGTRVLALMVCDSTGATHWGEGIDADSETGLSAIKKSEASLKLNSLFAASRPEFPRDMNLGYGYRLGFNRDYDEEFHDPEMVRSRLEQSLKTFGPAYAYKPQPRTYLAIVESSPEVELGVDGAAEEGSFHVVFGRY